MNTAIKAGTNFNSKYGKKLTDTAIKTGKDFATIAGKSSVKSSVLAHLKSQPRGQNFQAQI